jgi:hypothetical protein
MTDPDEVIRAAEEISGILESRGVGTVVIGAVALAAHGYVRLTEDLDLGVNTDLGTLKQVADALRKAGFEVELREPDDQDPLGGVVDVRGPFGLVQIVNYGGRFPAVIDSGIATADTVIRPASRLRIVPLPHGWYQARGGPAMPRCRDARPLAALPRRSLRAGVRGGTRDA